MNQPRRAAVAPQSLRPDQADGALLSTLAARLTEAPLPRLGYCCDGAGNITRSTVTTRAEVMKYAYDSLDRLTWIMATTGDDLLYR
jgi:YD repeat-containing protein